jgi:monoamine oxidase
MASRACAALLVLACALAVRSSSASESADVIIVGAGVAGVAAAQTLMANNISFIIVEASNRTGGRIHSSQFGHPDVAQIRIEVGANWIHGAGDNNPLWQIARTVGLKTNRVYGSTANISNYAVYDRNGELVPGPRLHKLVDEFTHAFNCANYTAQHSKKDVSMSEALYACGWTYKDLVSQSIEWEGTASDGAIPVTDMSLYGSLPDGTYLWCVCVCVCVCECVCV